MAIHYKYNILDLLKKAGYNTTTIRKEKLLPESVLQRLRSKDTNISLNTVGRLCNLLNCQPGDLFEYMPSSEDNQSSDL